MPYGKIFLESLPPYGTTHELADVERFLGGSSREKASTQRARRPEHREHGEEAKSRR